MGSATKKRGDEACEINEAMQVLQSAARLSGELTDCDYAMERFVKRAENA